MSKLGICLNMQFSNELLHLIIGLIPHPVFVKDEQGCFLLVNEAAGQLAGIPAEEMIGRKSAYWITDLEALASINQQDEKVIKEGMALYGQELAITDKEGVQHVYEITRVPIELPSGKRGLLGVSQEVTRQRRSEKDMALLLEEKELLLREVHHRIKNNMNNIAMFLTIQAETVKDPSAAAALRDASSRVQTMMVIYDKLYHSADFLNLPIRDYVTSLLQEVKQTFPRHERIRLHIKVADIILDSRKLFQAGMILNELFTNAMKYAYEDTQEGSIVIEVNDYEKHIELAVQDFGRGLPKEKENQGDEGFGLELVQILALQMGGFMEIKRGNGVRFMVKIKK